MLGLAGVTAMEVRVADPLLPPPHAVRDIARDPRNNIPRTNLIFFIRALHSLQPEITVQ
jgi:hypothetical protein